MSLKDGGAAFPFAAERLSNGEVVNYGWSGMTLRDYFAAKAMVMYGAALMESFNEETWDEFISNRAYKPADAMLAAREEGR
jgi:hypothetical protein